MLRLVLFFAAFAGMQGAEAEVPFESIERIRQTAEDFIKARNGGTGGGRRGLQRLCAAG